MNEYKHSVLTAESWLTPTKSFFAVDNRLNTGN